ncbi:MAG: nucleotide exchange factor GrpE [Aminobacteriaceae bacterium]
MKRFDDVLPQEREEEGSPPFLGQVGGVGDLSAVEASGKNDAIDAAIDSLTQEKQELEDALARARADFFNYRKRIERDRQKERAMIAEDNVYSFLPVLDNLDRALAVDPDSEGGSILKGVEMVRKQFLCVLESLGVSQIQTKGAPFSPEYHEAVAAVPTDDPEMNGLVVEEVMTGFRSKERVLRAAKVKVASFAQEK